MITVNLMPAPPTVYQQALLGLTRLVQAGASRFQPDAFIDQVHALRDRILNEGFLATGLSRLFSRYDDLHSDSELTPDQAQSLFEQLKKGPLPSLIPGYEILDIAGSGGFSRVYRGLEAGTGRAVAVKVGARSRAGSPSEPSSGLDQLRRAFDNEWAVLSRFRDSEKIVNAYVRGETDRGKPYIVMEFLPGGTLSQLFGAVNAGLMAFDLDRMLPLMLGAARCLAELHAAGIIHNDVKASNFLLTEKGEVKLADLAMAATVEAARRNAGNGGRRGTPGYIAPQTTEGLRKDVFALGIVFYKALTGKAPYPDEVAKLMRLSPLLALGRRPRPPSEVVPERKLPKRFDSILLKCVTMDAANRYPNAGTLAADLEKITRRKPRHPR
jgi:serine/threonine protein kinase